MPGLRTGPKSFNHFWPRLWLTAKPLGVEARKAKSKASLPGGPQSVEESVDSRIFVQGGPWIAQHVHLLTDPEGATLPERTTCVLFMKGSRLYEGFCPGGLDVETIQGVLKSVSEDRSQCVLCVHGDEERSSDSGDSGLNLDGPQTRVNTALTNPDIWWCIPYWVCADYKLHLEKIPVGRGYYFLVEPGQKFCIVSLNWAYEDVFVEANVDGKQCSKYSWFLEAPSPLDVQPVLFDMFESQEEGTVLKGGLLTFTRRQTSEQPSKGWEEEVAFCGAAVVSIYKAVGANEGESEAPGGSKTSSGDESTSAVEDNSRGTTANEGHMKPSERAISAAVKEDSKWAVHLSIASAAGEEAEATGDWFDCPEEVGRTLGSNVLHYRGPEWFQTIDLMLQDESMRASRMKKNASIIVRESSPEGATKDTAICLNDPPPQSAPAAQSPGGPVRKSKTFMVSYHEGGRDTPAKHVVRVPKTRIVATFKSMVKDALADEDLVGEGIRTTKMRWTYIESDGNRCEVDITSFTEASDLESSAALHVYALPKR